MPIESHGVRYGSAHPWRKAPGMVGNEPYEPPRMLDVGELTSGTTGPRMDLVHYYR